jgi:hypothetical protein
MKREIDGCIYDGRAKVIAFHDSGTSHIHRISSLYRSAHGRYFVGEEQEVHGVDGALLTGHRRPGARVAGEAWQSRAGGIVV